MHKVNVMAALVLAGSAASGNIAFDGKVTGRTRIVPTPDGRDFAVARSALSRNTLDSSRSV
ncbi:hypothetical protein A9K58_10630 [Stenotrophomonas maltophilia]|uniref:Uncharacterized protein n=1 Tax=Stenotrophomonas maltophilia TaxID=40324 RepID=A0A1A6XWE1_STEMA|nr:hypothetical protein [Stenotrophomonas maltophilia]OBU66896.1 hypothetical protein A9K58_10630 [Stenotrophomonas maltophilia]